MKKTILYFLTFVLAFAFFACQNEPREQEHEGPQIKELLPGRWELTSANRNGRHTELLTGTYFVFSPEGFMTTNFGIGNGQDRTSFIVEDNKYIRPQDDKKKHFSYEVVLIDDTTLVLKTSIRDVSIEMSLKKQEQENSMEKPEH